MRIGLYAAIALLSAAAGVFTARFIGSTDGNRLAVSGGDQTLGTLIPRTSPQAVPDLAFIDAEGKPHRLSKWRGKAVLLNLWATWCPPCRAELPSLDRLEAKLGSDKFTVLALSTDRTGPGQPAAFFAQQGIGHLAVYNDSTNTAISSLGAPGLPLSVLLDKEGREVARLLGPAEWDSPETIAKIKEYINRGETPG
ncbi:MAG: TlpA family protein disulfide reductase [Rhodomicrobium sp.]|nr:TlpA family protein disulfide reductase [Rhodomicrobium sp.]